MKPVDRITFFNALISNFGQYLPPSEPSLDYFNRLVDEGFKKEYGGFGELLFPLFNIRLRIRTMNYSWFSHHRYHSKNYVCFQLNKDRSKTEAVLMHGQFLIMEEIYKPLINNLRRIFELQRNERTRMNALGYEFFFDYDKKEASYLKQTLKGEIEVKQDDPFYSRMKFFEKERNVRNAVIYFVPNIKVLFKGVKRYSRIGIDIPGYARFSEIGLAKQDFIDFESLNAPERDDYVKGIEDNLHNCPKGTYVFNSNGWSEKFDSKWDL